MAPAQVATLRPPSQSLGKVLSMWWKGPHRAQTGASTILGLEENLEINSSHSRRNHDTERLGSLPEVTQLVRGKP